MRKDLTNAFPGIVIVDNIPELVRVYKKYFEMAGLKIVASFSRAQDMLEYFSETAKDRIKNKELESSVILLDYRMPEIDGEEAARRLRKVIPQATIILATGVKKFNLRIEESLFDAIIQKPFSIGELVQAIESVLPAWPDSLRGSQILDNPEDFDRLLRSVIESVKSKICICAESSFSSHGIGVLNLNALYARAREKKIPVQMITELTSENLYYCKQLMDHLGVQIRHVEGIRANFFMVDENHYAEALVVSRDSKVTSQVMYSNVEAVVTNNQYLFDALWSNATPAEKRIHELESRENKRNEITLISGAEEVLKSRINLVNNSKSSIDVCSKLDQASKSMCPELREAWIGANERGVYSRQISSITRQNVSVCKDLMEMGIDLRHLDNISGVFAINEKELLVKAAPSESEDGLCYVYSDFPLIVDQHRSIFSSLWNIAVPASNIIKELEESEKDTIDQRQN